MIIEIEGKMVEVDDSFKSLPPDQQNATVDEIAKSLAVQPAQGESDQSKSLRSDLSRTLQDFQSENQGALRSADSFMRGAADTLTFGMADELAGMANASMPFRTDERGLAKPSNPINAVVGFLSGDKDVDSEIRRERAFQAQRDDQDPYSSNTGRIAGALAGSIGLMKAGAPFTSNVPSNAPLLTKMAQGAKQGAVYSGLYGLGSGEGIGDRAIKGGEQAITGAVIGGAIPAIAEGFKAVTKPVRDAIKGYMDPAAYANQKISERLSDAGLTIDQAVNRIDDSNNLTLADVGGKSTRSLLRSTTNIPGKAQDYVTNRVNMRQLGQGDRIKNIIKETFADPETFEASKSKLFEIQAATSKPVYEKALSKQGVWNDRLQQFLDDPITKIGLNQGARIQRLESLAENVPFDPKDYAIVGFNEAGDPIIGGVPNMRTINVIKKGLDAMLGSEKYRNQITGRLTEEGRAIDAVRRSFLKEVDKVNPTYSLARRTYANFMQVNDAMEFGRKLFDMSPAFVKERVAEMTPMEKVAARAGAAEAMRKVIDKTGWTDDAVLRLFNSRQKVQNLQSVYSSKEEFAAARKMVFDEIKKRATYNAVKGNSTTARQLADMAESGGLRDTVDFASRTVTQGPVSASLQFIGSRMRMLGGFTPDVAEQTARKLMTSDPKTIKAIADDLARIESLSIAADQKRQLVQKLITPVLAQQGGRLIEQ